MKESLDSKSNQRLDLLYIVSITRIVEKIDKRSHKKLGVLNRFRRSDNSMFNSKRTRRQTMIYQTLHRILKIGQHEPHYKLIVNLVPPEGKSISAILVAILAKHRMISHGRRKKDRILIRTNGTYL